MHNPTYIVVQSRNDYNCIGIRLRQPSVCVTVCMSVMFDNLSREIAAWLNATCRVKTPLTTL